MHFAFTEEQEELKRSARRFLESNSGSREIRKAMESETGYDPDIWRRITGELGWTSLIIPEAYGGAGLGFVELAALFEEMGRALLCAPFFSTVCLGVTALLVGGTEEQKRSILPRVAEGSARLALACTPPSGRWAALGSDVMFSARGKNYELTGESSFVIDGHTADILLVAARPSAGANSEIFVVEGDAAGLTRKALPTMDMTRKQAAISLRNVTVPSSSLLGQPGHGAATLARVLDLAKAALAVEQVGGAQRCLDMSVDYAKTRTQFGRPIGSFQAIKHKLADVFVEVESARSAAYYAAWAAAEPFADLPQAAAMAKAYCSDAYFRAAAECIQVHGGVGFTWEHDAHLFFKRARSSEILFGDAAFHRDVVAVQMGL